MKFLKINLFILTAILVASCGSSGPTAKDDLKKLKSYNTYAYLPNKDTIIDRDYDNDVIHSNIIETINTNMRENGFSLDKRLPDVLLYVYPMFDEKVSINANPVYTNYAYYRPGLYVGPYYQDFLYDNYFTVQRITGPRVNQVPYRERSIVIDFIDRRTNEILYRGTLEESIETRRMDRETRKYIDDIFKELF